MAESIEQEKMQLRRERFKLLHSLQNTLETPMIILGFLWLILLIAELIWGLNAWLQGLSTVIWVVFILDFLIQFFLAPDKSRFIKTNILTLISLIVPALRLFRIARAIRVVRGFRLVKVISSINRG
ncbi:MAG: hypothetical protein ACXWDO_11535, partial [Bacteroidia bacterium]